MTSSAFETATPDSVTYIDRLAASDLGRSYKRRMLDELELRAGHRVVYLGCGPENRPRCARPGSHPTGAVIGIDHDRDRVYSARARTRRRVSLSPRQTRSGVPLASAAADP